MADKLSRDQRSWNMSRIRSKGMQPELVVRKLVHAMGYRFRLHRKNLPGKPDLVFGPRKKAIFVHGCFWHQHDDPACKISRLPKSRPEYWKPKLQRNVERDRENQDALSKQGWQVLTVWECQTKDIEELTSSIKAFLSG